MIVSFALNQPTVFFVVSLFFCCCLWYLYRPLTTAILFLKNKLFFSSGIRPAYFLSHHAQSNQFTWVTRLASRISRKLAIKTPKIVIDRSQSVNAKVVPGFFHAPLVIFTQGLLDKLTPDEAEAVLAHELAHVAMNDTLGMSITDLIMFITVWLPVYFCHLLIDYVFFYKWRNRNIGFIFSLLAVLLAYGFFSLLVLNSINRRYELRADKVAMSVVNVQSFLNALHRVHAAESHIPGALEWCVASMPKGVQKFILQLFLSHPSIPARIEALQ